MSLTGRRSLSCFALAIVCLASLFLGGGAVALPSIAQASLSQASHGEMIRAFAALGDRSVGSEGARQAADAIEQYFTDLSQGREGWVVGRQMFQTPVIQTHSSIIELNGRQTRLTPLLLNALSAAAIPHPGVSGEILYVGKGELGDFNGLDVHGAFVLMDMDSGKNWQNAAMLGARALIYIDDNQGGARRGLFEDKFELTPIDFPRFWMKRAQAQTVFGGVINLDSPGASGAKGRIVSTLNWENTRADNIYCFIPGADEKLAHEVLMVDAFYDSTAYVAHQSPGADEAASLAALLETARMFAQNPQPRSVLLVAAAAHVPSQHGMRELLWALQGKGKDIKKFRKKLEQRQHSSAMVLERLNSTAPFALDKDDEKSVEGARHLADAINSIIKTGVDGLSTRLMRLRLATKEERDELLIKDLAQKRLALQRLGWLDVARNPGQKLTPDQQELMDTIIPLVLKEQDAINKDAQTQLKGVKSGLRIRKLLDEKKIVAASSLHLSSHGDGLGGFAYGWLYELKSKIKRGRLLSPLNELMLKTGKQFNAAEFAQFYDTLTPNQSRPWQGFLPDRPKLGGEVSALAGLPGFTLATTYDARASWGAPSDTPDRVNFDFLNRQLNSVKALLLALASAHLSESGAKPVNSFTTLIGNANVLRQGEVFPDMPAVGSVFLTFQYTSRMYSMVDTAGKFRVPGIANYKHSVHKAILEGFTFDPDTGLAVRAVDKNATGKRNYRVKMKRSTVEADQVMFTCSQSTFFNMLDPRNFNFLYIPELIDGRTESKPLKYWLSRLDTRSSVLGTFFLEPGTPLKLALSDNFINRKVLILNSTDKRPAGEGFQQGKWPVVPLTDYQAAEDMWRLLGPRMRNLEAHGIVNDKLRRMLKEGEDQLAEAREFIKERIWDKGLEFARASLAIASLAYNSVDETQKDVLAGVLFYIALFIPFAYCLERLLFGFADIHKRIIAFSAILLGIIAVIYSIHPAFQLTYSPTVVILAFFILGLSTMVSLIIFFRFEREMVELQRRSRHMKPTSISRTAAFAAAFQIGVSNLRRRPLRTILTCVTLIILTFTIMNFTAVKSVRQRGWVDFSDKAAYDGLFLKHFGWKSLPIEALSIVEDMFRDSGAIAPRIWYTIDDSTRAPAIPISLGERREQARGLIGLSHLEPDVTHMNKNLVWGRWFDAPERNVVILPHTMAQDLGLNAENAAQNPVTLWGMKFTVVGAIADDALMEHEDLDGEPVTPIIYPNEAARELSDVEAEAIAQGEDVVEYQSRYQHVDGEDVLIMPAKTLLTLAGGAKLQSMAVRVNKSANTGAAADALGERFGLMLFRGDDTGTSLYFSADAFSYSGMGNILIPMAISVLIVLNTMIGSVYERRGEIGVYTSVGLAPSHVSFLFVAEALAFAVLSVVAGYLLAQTAAGLFSGTALWAGMTANYSSLGGVAAMVLVIIVVLISVIYPSKVASDIAIPDVRRSWSMPKAKGDVIQVTLPFLVKPTEQLCAGGFLMDYYNAHQDVSHGLFSTDKLHCNFLPTDELSTVGISGYGNMSDLEACLFMDLMVWLAPFDFGVRQRVRLVFCPSDIYTGFKQITVRLERLAGEDQVWQNLNKNFLNDLRKQLLAWRSLDDETRTAFELKMSLNIDGESTPDEA